MEPDDAVKYIINDSLLITPADRVDMITKVLGCYRTDDKSRLRLAGMILTGDTLADKSLADLLNKARLPVLLAKTDTYTAAACIHDLTVKIRPQDSVKINKVVELIKENVDLDKIFKGI
jgi:BioD-like phosphotransacetylase family protein